MPKFRKFNRDMFNKTMRTFRCFRCGKMEFVRMGRPKFCGSKEKHTGCSEINRKEVANNYAKNKYHTNLQFREYVLRHSAKGYQKNAEKICLKAQLKRKLEGKPHRHSKYGNKN